METKLHAGIIIDGNRRYAKKLLLETWKGHEKGRERVEELIDYVTELELKELTIYTLSQENIKNRSQIELTHLYRIFREMFKNINKPKIKEKGIKINFIGDLDLIPGDLKKECLNLEEETKNNQKFIINFAVAYSGRQEIIEAVKKIINKKIKSGDINEEIIKENLYLKDDPDFIIRTGGDKRTSNFLPFQSTYSEWFFLDKTWPEFTKEDLKNCIDEFKTRKRNFGK